MELAAAAVVGADVVAGAAFVAGADVVAGAAVVAGASVVAGVIGAAVLPDEVFAAFGNPWAGDAPQSFSTEKLFSILSPGWFVPELLCAPAAWCRSAFGIGFWPALWVADAGWPPV